MSKSLFKIEYLLVVELYSKLSYGATVIVPIFGNVIVKLTVFNADIMIAIFVLYADFGIVSSAFVRSAMSIFTVICASLASWLMAKFFIASSLEIYIEAFSLSVSIILNLPSL